MPRAQALADKERAKAQEMIAKKRLRQLNPDSLTVKEFASYRARLEETQARAAPASLPRLGEWLPSGRRREPAGSRHQQSALRAWRPGSRSDCTSNVLGHAGALTCGRLLDRSSFSAARPCARSSLSRLGLLRAGARGHPGSRQHGGGATRRCGRGACGAGRAARGRRRGARRAGGAARGAGQGPPCWPGGRWAVADSKFLVRW